MKSDYGFFIQPEDEKGIIRISTTHQLRVWISPRRQQNLEIFSKEVENVSVPGLYILLDGKHNKVYVGESINLFNRLNNHFNNPEQKIAEWDKVIIITNGRPASMSLFNDSIVRKSLEFLTIKLMKANKYTVVSQGSEQVPSPSQRNVYQSLFDELTQLLLKENIISKLIDEAGQEELFKDDIKELLRKANIKVITFTAKEVISDKGKIFNRPGSLKSKGWQITFRGGKPGSFLYALENGEGFLLVARGSAPLIPLTELKKLIIDPNDFKRDTFDMFVKFEGEKVLILYHDRELDVSKFKLIK